MRTVGKIAVITSLLGLSSASLYAFENQDFMFDSTSIMLAKSNQQAAEKRTAAGEATCNASEEELKERLVELTQRFQDNMLRVETISAKIEDAKTLKAYQRELTNAEKSLHKIHAARIQTARELVELREKSRVAVMDVHAKMDAIIMRRVDEAIATAEAALSAAK